MTVSSWLSTLQSSILGIIWSDEISQIDICLLCPSRSTLPSTDLHLDFISQFITDLRQVQGLTNAAADVLSRLGNALHTDDSSVIVNFRAMAVA